MTCYFCENGGYIGAHHASCWKEFLRRIDKRICSACGLRRPAPDEPYCGDCLALGSAAPMLGYRGGS